jgi:hypothetical protein
VKSAVGSGLQRCKLVTTATAISGREVVRLFDVTRTANPGLGARHFVVGAMTVPAAGMSHHGVQRWKLALLVTGAARRRCAWLHGSVRPMASSAASLQIAV